MARALLVLFALLVAAAACHSEPPVCAGGKRCDPGYVVKSCVVMKAYPHDCDELERSGLELTCHSPVVVQGETQDIRDYCAKDPSYVAPVVTWSERLTQVGAGALAIVIALFTGARARRNQARKRQLGIYDDA